MEAVRYLAPAPTGVLLCLGMAPESEERRFFELLVGAGQPQSVDMPGFARALDLSAADLARTMFALNRNRRITVLEGAPTRRESWVEDEGLAGLTHDLVAVAAPGQKILLAGSDGMAIARVGWSAYEADVMAARTQRDLAASQPEIWPLVIGGRSFVLSANSLLDQRHPAWLQFGYRLLQGCGKLH